MQFRSGRSSEILERAMHVCLIRFDTKVALQVFWLVEQNSPVEDENSSDEESRDDVSQDPHQTVFLRSLREEKRSVTVWHTSVSHRVWGLGSVLTMRNRGRCSVLRMCRAFVVTEWTPAHHASEYNHGWLITYRLVLMFTEAYFLKSQTHSGETLLGRQRHYEVSHSLILLKILFWRSSFVSQCDVTWHCLQAVVLTSLRQSVTTH